MSKNLDKILSIDEALMKNLEQHIFGPIAMAEIMGYKVTSGTYDGIYEGFVAYVVIYDEKKEARIELSFFINRNTNKVTKIKFSKLDELSLMFLPSQLDEVSDEIMNAI